MDNENKEKLRKIATKAPKDGKGLMLWADGTVFKGQYRGGKACGQGQLKKPNGDRYEGTFVNDEAEGMGVYYYRSGA